LKFHFRYCFELIAGSLLIIDVSIAPVDVGMVMPAGRDGSGLPLLRRYAGLDSIGIREGREVNTLVGLHDQLIVEMGIEADYLQLGGDCSVEDPA
jgi:hypothetical protein